MPQLAPLLLLLACQKAPADPDSGPPAAPQVCPRPAVAVEAVGDANGDGAVDLGDAVLLLRHDAAGGPAPACDDAVDLVPDGRVELDDAFTLLVHLYEGVFDLGAADADGCGDAAPIPPPASCADLQVTLEGPSQSSVGSFEVELTLATTELAVEAWSLPISAEGCRIAEATTAGTVAASVADDPPGLRDLGHDATFARRDDATSAVILSYMQAVSLPADGLARAVLRLVVEAEDCGACTLTLGDPVDGLGGPPVEAVVVAAGASWPLPAQSLQVQICD